MINNAAATAWNEEIEENEEETAAEQANIITIESMQRLFPSLIQQAWNLNANFYEELDSLVPSLECVSMETLGNNTCIAALFEEWMEHFANTYVKYAQEFVHVRFVRRKKQTKTSTVFKTNWFFCWYVTIYYRHN